MSKPSKLAVIGFDSISLPFLDTFVKRGVMPTVGKLMAAGSTTQTWPCFPMETATNWACLATGATPAVHGCNMGMPQPGGPMGKVVQAFPADYCTAEQLWSAAHRAGKRSVVFDWTQSYPLAFEDGLIHVGEDGRPHCAIRSLQECCAYTTNDDIPPAFHVKRIEPAAAGDGLAFEMPITPNATNPFPAAGLPFKYRDVSSLFARINKGAAGYESVSVFGEKGGEPLFTVPEGEWSEWGKHTFTADGEHVPAHVRGKLVNLSPDGKDVHLYLSQIYPAEGFCHPADLAPRLVDACGPYVTQCSRQQVVIQNASDIATYFQEQEYMGNWYRKAAGHVLGNEEWDLFMLKWHGPDWTNHLSMHMIDPDHAMYDPDRAEEGWAYWDSLMHVGDEIVRTVMEAAGPDAAIALVSDHGGATHYGGKQPPGPQAVLRELGLTGGDGQPAKAWALKHYVYINTTDRFADGVVEPDSAEFHEIRNQIIERLLTLTDDQDRAAFQCVLPMEEAARFGVAGTFAGDVFVIPRHEDKPTKEEFFELHPDPKKRGTWDWPRLNSGAHSDDSYFVLAGPGIRQGSRRAKPTRITSVAPTLATALGIPTPKDADGAVLWDFFG